MLLLPQYNDLIYASSLAQLGFQPAETYKRST